MPVKPSRIQAFFEYILDNLFDILTIALAGYVVVRHQVRPFTAEDVAELATWILAVLGLIAVSGIWERNRRLGRVERLARESRDLIARQLNRTVLAGDFFIPDPRLPSDVFATADHICLAGMTLRRTLRDHMEILRQRLRAGANVRVIILDPNEEAVMDEATRRSHGATTPNDWRARIYTVQTDIRIIGEVLDSASRGELEVGYLPYIPSFGFKMIDPNETHAYCQIEIYQHRSVAANPTFDLRRADDGDWFTFFQQQYEILWQSCRQVSYPLSEAEGASG
jgi:hypothetical protein